MYTEDYYAILGIDKTATADEIKTAYRLMCKAHHPDAGGDALLMQLVNKAYITLSDLKLREAYDRTYTTSNTQSKKEETFSDMIINCYFFSEISGIDIGQRSFSSLPYDSINYITQNQSLYKISYKDGTSKYFLSHEDWYNECQAIRNKKNYNTKSTVAIFAIIAFLIVLLCFGYSNSTDTYNFASNPSPTPTPLSQTPPEHGETLYNIPRKRRASYIEFETSEMHGDYCYIKAVDSNSGELVQAAFIHTAKGYRMHLPLGTYELYYACGNTWYGYNKLFASEGIYSYCDSTFTLTYDEYYTVTLYSVIDGNMDTENIDYEEFASIS